MSATKASIAVAVLPGEGAVGVHQPRRRGAALALALLAARLGGGGDGLALAFGGLGEFDLVERQVAERGVEAQRGHARREMVGQLGGDVDLAAVGMIDPEAPRVEMELAADRAGQEGVLAAIFAVADDRMADREHDGRAAGGCGR